MVDYISKDVSDIDLTTIISEVNLVEFNPKEWWINTGATSHICSGKKMFSTFESIKTGERGRELCHFINQGPKKSGLEDSVCEGANSDQCPICA